MVGQVYLHACIDIRGVFDRDVALDYTKKNGKYISD